MSKPPPGLLVSVRSATEALAALEGGASLIDVKEPANGALGRADDQVIAEVRCAVGELCPVSAALGEWLDGPITPAVPGLSYVKWGLAGCRCVSDWRQQLRAKLQRAGPPETVLVAYADWQCAQAPPVDDVVALACERPGSVLLFDTHCKTPGPRSAGRPTLLDWLPASSVIQLCRQARNASVRVALAGSLGPAEIVKLLAAEPDWFAVRGAVCEHEQRDGEVCAKKVRRLLEVIRGPAAVRYAG